MIKLPNIVNRVKQMSWQQLAISYGVIGLLTSGWAVHHHAAVNAEHIAMHEEVCQDIDKRLANPMICYHEASVDYTPDPLVGFFSGVLWPIYWTWSIFDLIPTQADVKVVTVTKTERVYVDSTPSDDSSDSSDSSDK